jgi:hypothetical protein
MLKVETPAHLYMLPVSLSGRRGDKGVRSKKSNRKKIISIYYHIKIETHSRASL